MGSSGIGKCLESMELEVEETVNRKQAYSPISLLFYSIPGLLYIQFIQRIRELYQNVFDPSVCAVAFSIKEGSPARRARLEVSAKLPCDQPRLLSLIYPHSSLVVAKVFIVTYLSPFIPSSCKSVLSPYIYRAVGSVHFILYLVALRAVSHGEFHRLWVGHEWCLDRNWSLIAPIFENFNNFSRRTTNGKALSLLQDRKHILDFRIL